MRIALVSPYDLSIPGGVQSHVQHLAEELRRAGEHVATVSPGPTGGPDHHGVGGTVRVPFNDSVAPIALAPTAIRRTRASLDDIAPDVVHVHEPAVPWVSLAATLRPAAPTVGTFHAWSDRDLAYRMARPLVRRAVSKLAARVAVSEAARDYHTRALGLPAGRFRVIPNGVDVGRFASAEPIDDLVAEDRPYLLFVGRLEARKGLEQLIRAYLQLRANGSDTRLLVVGEGPERDRCQQLVPEGLRSDVTFAGRVEGDQLARFYRSADVFVSPALGGESFGIVLLEAMAAGCPVVASDIPGYRSVLEDGKNGRLVSPGDPGALATAIGELLDNAATRRALVEEARRGVADYDWSAVAGQLLDVYREVAG
ncbi:MAG: glycosyltransferase family 4 protein [Nitriliruptorales bacterium]|nr:glycosyltransferase family 4 protein [Nitriliruptorales bacterium]